MYKLEGFLIWTNFNQEWIESTLLFKAFTILFCSRKLKTCTRKFHHIRLMSNEAKTLTLIQPHMNLSKYVTFQMFKCQHILIITRLVITKIFRETKKPHGWNFPNTVGIKNIEKLHWMAFCSELAYFNPSVHFFKVFKTVMKKVDILKGICCKMQRW